MPTPAKTSAGKLVEIGIALATEGGADAVTVAAVAKAAGIKGPSIYKYFADRETLLTAVQIAVLHSLEARLTEATGRTPRQRIVAVAHAYRAFGKAAPRLYAVLYRKNAADDTTLAAVYQASINPLFEQFAAAGVPPKRILTVGRTLVPFLHGFVSMEIAQAFRLGGNLDDAFAAGLETILREI